MIVPTHIGPEFRNGAGITDPDGVNFPWINLLNPP